MNLTNATKRKIEAWIGIATLLAAAGCGGDSGGSTGDLPNPGPAAYTYAAPAEIGDSWAVEDAALLNMDVALLEAMMNAVRQGEFPIVDSIAIAHQGKLILHETVRTSLNEFDDWVDNADPAMHAQFSVSKSIASILVGVGIDQGVFSGVDVQYLSLFPYADYENWDERKNDITLHDVLSMQAGLEWNEWDPPYSDPANQMFVFYDNHVDFSKGLLDLPMAADPGSEFAYNTVATVSLGQALENSAPLSLIDYGSQFLLAPLGISQIEVFRTPTGLLDLGRGIYLTSRDLLKFGQLYMDDGQWNGQRVISDEWVATSLLPYTEMSWAEPEKMEWTLNGYGYQWWLGHFEVDGETYETFAAWGHGEQWLMAIPALQLVVAINSHGWEGRREQTNEVFSLIRRFLLPAVN